MSVRILAGTLLLCASLAALQPPSVARAADFQYVVDNALDTNLTATPACTSDAKDCSLRQAILKANADSGTRSPAALSACTRCKVSGLRVRRGSSSSTTRYWLDWVKMVEISR